MDTKIVVFIIIAVIVGFGIGYYVGYDIGFERAASRRFYSEDNGMMMDSMRVGSNAIYVPDQMPGNMIIVEFVSFQEDGFVVVHESKDGKPGAILGNSALVTVGGDQKIAIQLSRESRDGEELVAMLHRDDGDGTFAAANDTPVKDEQGNTIMMPFLISRDAVAPDAVNP